MGLSPSLERPAPAPAPARGAPTPPAVSGGTDSSQLLDGVDGVDGLEGVDGVDGTPDDAPDHVNRHG